VIVGVGLRIDVDFAVGLRRGVPWLLDRLAERSLRATFFVVAGRNSSRRVLRRAVEPRYLGRLCRLGPIRIARRLGLPALRDEGFLDSVEARRALDRIVGDGHELAAHGHDHAWWADEVWRAEPGRLIEEIDRARAVLERATGARGIAWGSPSWRTTDAVLEHLARSGVPYLAECWGREPFRTIAATGEPIRVPHLPISLPSLEAEPSPGRNAAAAVGRVLDAVDRAKTPAVLCAHDYFEGLLRRDLFVSVLDGLVARGARTLTLTDLAGQVAPGLDDLPACRVVRAPAPGFHGFVSWQGTPVPQMSRGRASALVAHGAEPRGDEE
jgi:peptidoglycan/xylan/chitin deacetylase (PgdA/CDA1 family)